MGFQKLFVVIIAFNIIGCSWTAPSRKPLLSRQIDRNYTRVCSEHFKPEFNKEGNQQKEFELHSAYDNPLLFKIKFIVPSAQMLKVRPSLDKRLYSCELYLGDEKIAWLFLDDTGCVEYADLDETKWKEWFKPIGLGNSLNEIYYSVTGKDPSLLDAGQDKTSAFREPAFSYEKEYQWGTTVSDIVRISLRDDVKKAFDLLKFGAPAYNNIVTGGSGINIKGKKDLRLQLVMGDDPFLSAKPVKFQLAEKKSSYRPDSFDAWVTLFNNTKDDSTEIISSVILDKILFEPETGKWLSRDEYIPRMSFALAHQIYGLVHEYIEKDNEELKSKRSKREIIREDVRAIKEGMAFLKRVIKSKEFENYSPAMQNEFKRLLQNEQKHFKIWTYMMRAQRQNRLNESRDAS